MANDDAFSSDTVTRGVRVQVTSTFLPAQSVVDGAVGAEWFKHFKDAVENPLSLLL